MYNKEGVARCHADRQPTERPTRARGTRGRQTSTVNFISFFRRCSVFRSFAISPSPSFPDMESLLSFPARPLFICPFSPSFHYTHIYIYLLFATRERYSTSPEISNPFRDEKRRSIRLCAVYARFTLPLLPKDSIKISAAWSRTTRGL